MSPATTVPNTSECRNTPTDRRYRLIVAQSLLTKDIKDFVSNAPESVPVTELLRVAVGRGGTLRSGSSELQEEAEFGDFELRTYGGLIRHWLCSSMAMHFLAEQTQRLRGKHPQTTLEQVANTMVEKV